MKKHIDDPRTFAVIGAAMHVHRVLGYEFSEKVYHEALTIEFPKRTIPFVHEVDLPITYEGTLLKAHYRADFICYDDIIVEIKALTEMGKAEIAQVFNYLKATGFETALLINFGAKSLQYHRITNPFQK